MRRVQLFSLRHTKAAGHVFSTWIVYSLLFSFGTYTVAGCYSYSAGPLVRTEMVPGSEVTDSYTYQTELEKTPTVEDTRAQILITKTPQIRYTQVEKRAEVQQTSGIGSLLMMVASVGAIVGGYQIDSLAGNNGGQKALGIGLMVIGGVLFFGSLFAMKSAGQVTQTGDLVNGQTSRTFRSGTAVPLSNQKVIVTAGRTSREYTTDWQGMFTFDPVADFGMTYFSGPQNVYFNVRVPNGNVDHTITLSSAKWTREYFTVDEQNTYMHSYADLRSRRLAELPRGSEIQLLSEYSGWYHVSNGERDGWVQKGSGHKFWATATHFDPNRPPQLAASLSFSEPSGNNMLDADENGTITVKLTNVGRGEAYRIGGNISPQDSPGLYYTPQFYVGDIMPGESKSYSVSISASHSVTTHDGSLEFRFNEANGFEPPPTRITFSTKAFVPPKLLISDVGVQDVDGNNMIQPGKIATVTVRVQNIGLGIARDVTAGVRNGDPQNVFFTTNSDTSFSLGNLSPGNYKDIRFSMYTNNRAAGVPIYVNLTEQYGAYGLSNYKLPLEFYKPMASLNEVVVKPNQQQTPGIEPSTGLSVGVDTNIPQGREENPNAVALILAISNYQNPGIPAVKYAKHDGAVIRQYLIKALGFKPENILPRDPDELLTYGQIQTYIKKILPSYLKPDGSSDLFIYYTGHGAPSTTKVMSVTLCKN
ncbi:MAG: SH3 domain-containing protein [Bacteroidetes bacterium]|nr:SH3 domain-containing protein [Bacteroidota bacterium]